MPGDVDIHLKLGRMEEAGYTFHWMAASIGVDRFVAFASLMHQYIGLCREALEGGCDFTRAYPPLSHDHMREFGATLQAILGPGLLDALPLGALLYGMGLNKPPGASDVG